MPTRDGQPVLSICIPTYNRSDMLVSLLEDLDRPGFLPFEFDVIVTDNASPDPGYAEIACYKPSHYRLSYYRRPTNIGAEPNVFGGLRMANGEFCLYVGDDDRLIPEMVAEIVRELQADDGAAVGFAAWQAYDLVDHRVIHNDCAFEDARFEFAEAEIMLEWLMSLAMNHPEHAIYRTSAIRRCLFPPISLTATILHLERLIRFGAVRFFSRPFLNLVGRHPAEPGVNRMTNGSNQGSTGWHRQLHSFAVIYARLAGKPLFQGTGLAASNTMFVAFCNALLDAQRNRRPLEAWEQFQLTKSVVDYPIVPPDEALRIAQRAAIQSTRLAAESFWGVERLMLMGFDPASGRSLLSIESGDRGAPLVWSDDTDYDNAAILVPTAAIAVEVQARLGIHAGRVFDLETIYSHFWS